jgi:hypothetical protein
MVGVIMFKLMNSMYFFGLQLNINVDYIGLD